MLRACVRACVRALRGYCGIWYDNDGGDARA